MIDARISVGLPSHPKTKKLIRRVGEGGAWRLVCLFLWAAQTRPDGDLSGMTGEDIELAADWQGEEGAFIGALVEVGFIDGEEGCYEIHDWQEHNPWAAGAEARSEKARWNAMCKHHGRAKASEMMPEYAARLRSDAESKEAASKEAATRAQQAIDSPATSMRRAGNSSAPSPLPSPLPSPSTNSEANASGGKPPTVTDPNEIIFGYGVPLLTNAGTPEKQARSFLGGLRKEHGDAALIDKLRDCIKAKPLQPVEWLAAALPPKSRASPGRMPAAESFATKDYGTGGLI